MAHKFKVYFIFFAAFVLSGCATDLMGKKGGAMMAARYGDLEKHALEEVQDITKSKTVKLFPLCAAYAKLKKYNKLFPCLEQMEINVKNGDTNMVDIEQMEKDSPFMMGLAKMGSTMAGASLEQDVTPYLYIMRAEAYMDIGEYGKAIEEAKRGIAAKPKDWNLEKWHEINTLGPLMLAHALGGEREKALAHAKRMEAISTSYPHGLLAIDKHVWLAKTYVSMGEYQRALHFMEIQEGAFDSFARGVADAMVGSVGRGESMWEFPTLPPAFLPFQSQL